MSSQRLTPDRDDQVIQAAAADRVTNVAVKTFHTKHTDMPAYCLAIGDRIEFDIRFDAVAIDGATTHVMGIEIGGVTIKETAARIWTAGDWVRFKGVVTILTLGGPGSADVEADMEEVVGGLAPATTHVDAAITPDTTAAGDFKAYTTPSAAAVGNQIDLTRWYVKHNKAS